MSTNGFSIIYITYDAFFANVSALITTSSIGPTM